MKPQDPFCLGLIVTSGIYAQRAARAQLDAGLLAVALDFQLRVYFLGDAVLQLMNVAEPGEALLPAGYRGWGGIPGMVEDAGFASFAEPAWLERLQDRKSEFSIWPEPMTAAQMRLDWQGCQRVWIL